MTGSNRRILIVDDNRAIHDDFRKILRGRSSADASALERELFGLEPSIELDESAGFELTSAYQGHDGVALVRAARQAGQPFAMALVDMRMPPGLDGIETISAMWEVDPELQVVICTAFSDASRADLVRRFGATDRLLILKKPFDVVEVLQLAFALTEKWKLAAESRIRMAELDQSRADLAASLALARAVQEASIDGIVVVGPDHRVATANRRFIEMWCLSAEAGATAETERWLGLVLDQVIDPPEFMARVAYLHDHPSEVAADELRLKDGRVFERWTGPVRSAGGDPDGRLWCFRDVTERRRLERERTEVTERMASLGRLAAGVGHEINNPLTYALGNVENVLESCADRGAVPPIDELVEAMQDTRDGLWRIRVIVRDLQTLSRSEEDLGEIDLAEVVEQALQIAGAQIRHRAPIVRRYAPVPPVTGSRTRLGQVFLNLIVNAAQAIPDGQAAANKIELTIRSTDTDSIVDVTDTGSGIAPDDIDRIFDPFFTTKEIGAGTGLGLSISREIVISHRGTLTVRSVLGVGTTMTVAIPHAIPLSIGVAAGPASREPARPASRARVLVIDDEPLITRTLQKGLGARHHIVVSPQAGDALARIERGETFDVILCDLMMPDISGIDVHDYLVRAHPDVVPRIIFMTGGAFTPKAKQFLDNVANPRIHKPFSIAEISLVVDRCLETRGATG